MLNGRSLAVALAACLLGSLLAATAASAKRIEMPTLSSEIAVGDGARVAEELAALPVAALAVGREAA